MKCKHKNKGNKNATCRLNSSSAVRLSTLLIISTALVGCAGSWGINSVSSDGVTVMATEKGMQSWFDGMTGLTMMGKSELNPHQDNSHHELRRNQERTRQMKFMVTKPMTKKGGAK